MNSGNTIRVQYSTVGHQVSDKGGERVASVQYSRGVVRERWREAARRPMRKPPSFQEGVFPGRGASAWASSASFMGRRAASSLPQPPPRFLAAPCGSPFLESKGLPGGGTVNPRLPEDPPPPADSRQRVEAENEMLLSPPGKHRRALQLRRGTETKTQCASRGETDAPREAIEDPG